LIIVFLDEAYDDLNRRSQVRVPRSDHWLYIYFV